MVVTSLHLSPRLGERVIHTVCVIYYFLYNVFIMGLPRQRKTKSATAQNRSHRALKKINLAKCKNCHMAVMPHEVCRNCGFYRGRQVRQIAVKK